jgi:hypothetical protein
MAQTLFVEVFPIIARPKDISAYIPHLRDGAPPQVGARLAYRLSQAVGGGWAWWRGGLLTDSPASEVQLNITLDILRPQFADVLNDVQGIEAVQDWHVTPDAEVAFSLQTTLREREHALRHALKKFAVPLPNGRIAREPFLQGWVVDGEPAVSLSIRSHVTTAKTLQETLIARNETLKNAIGWRVMDITSPSLIGTITAIRGVVAQHRARLMGLSKRDVMQTLIQNAPDGEVVVSVSVGTHEYEYVASALAVVVSTQASDLERFDIPPAQAYKLIRLAPHVRADLVKALSDVLKADGIIGSAYNSRTHDKLFSHLDFKPSLVYAENRVRPHDPKTIGDDFMKCKPYRKHARFNDRPIKIAVINALEESIEDFIEALRRLLEKQFGFAIEMIKERKIKVLTPKNVESAVRVIEKEAPDVLLAFFTEAPNGEDADESQAKHLKTLTLSKGIATQIVTLATMHDLNAMPYVAMSLLAKTGNVPFALAEPLEYADYVVGLGFIRERMSKGDRVTAITRIYQSDGVFVRYTVDSLDLERDEPVPYILLQTVLPIQTFEKKRVLLHHDGEIAQEMLQLLGKWGATLHAQLIPIEILRHHTPRVYGLSKSVTQPEWGSTFFVNASEAFVVSSVPSADSTAQPLHVRVSPDHLSIEAAVYSVLAWTLLYYGAWGMPRLPVTIHAAEDMAEWLAKGYLPAQREGDVPFWL